MRRPASISRPEGGEGVSPWRAALVGVGVGVTAAVHWKGGTASPPVSWHSFWKQRLGAQEWERSRSLRHLPGPGASGDQPPGEGGLEWGGPQGWWPQVQCSLSLTFLNLKGAACCWLQNNLFPGRVFGVILFVSKSVLILKEPSVLHHLLVFKCENKDAEMFNNWPKVTRLPNQKPVGESGSRVQILTTVHTPYKD